MGIWKGIKTAAKWFVGGSSENGMDVVKGVGTWIDERKFTEEEKAKFQLEAAKHYGDYLRQTMDENSERSRTRRALALLVIRWWLLMLTFSACLYPINALWSEYVFKIASMGSVGLLVAGVGGFFFGTHLLRSKK